MPKEQNLKKTKFAKIFYERYVYFKYTIENLTGKTQYFKVTKNGIFRTIQRKGSLAVAPYYTESGVYTLPMGYYFADWTSEGGNKAGSSTFAATIKSNS